MVAKKNSTTSTKPVTPREDPVLRAERLLAEAKAKAAATAEKQLDGAEKDLAIAITNRDKWQGFVDARTAKVAKLKRDLGLETPAEADAEDAASSEV